jgi:GGDEF domain-containing protein
VDVPGRCKANRLAIIFPETYSSRAVVVGERIRERLKGQPISDELKHLRVTCSVGVVSFPTHAREENELMFKALEFLEIARSEGTAPFGTWTCRETGSTTAEAKTRIPDPSKCALPAMCRERANRKQTPNRHRQ